MEHSSVLKVPEAAQTAAEHFRVAVDHFIQVITDPNSTMADVRDAGRDLWDACRDTGEQSAEGLKQALRERFAALGWSEEQIDDWFEHKWEDVKDLADQVREAAPKVKKTAKYLWAKVTAGLAVAALFVVGMVAGHQKGEVVVDLSNQVEDANRQNDDRRQLQERERQFDDFTAVLETPIPDVQAPQTAVARLPAPVAVVAAQPLVVTIQAPSGITRKLTSSIGRVWYSMPSSRTSIEGDAESQTSKREATPNPNSCFARDCLSEHPHSRLHVDADVESPLDDGKGGHITAHIHSD